MGKGTDTETLIIRTPLGVRRAPVDAPDKTRGSWFIDQRLRFIESRLFWTGTINRSDLVEHFQIHKAIASGDLAEYQRLAPRNAVYDKSSKVYRAGRQFLPIFPNPSLSALHAHTRLQDGFAPLDSVFEVPPALDRVADAAVARNLAAACREGFALRIRYRSMSNPDGALRWVEPRHLVSDGLRWHTRAWCHERQGFRDFVLSRIDEANESRPGTAIEQADPEWEQIDQVVLKPHHLLTPKQRQMVAQDHGMTAQRLEIPCRRALLWYLLRNLGLDVDDVPPRQVLELTEIGLRKKVGLDRSRCGTPSTSAKG